MCRNMSKVSAHPIRFRGIIRLSINGEGFDEYSGIVGRLCKEIQPLK